MRMSSCFFSSRLKMRTARISVVRRRRNTALPKEPVPPVIMTVLLSNKGPARRGFPVVMHRGDECRPGGRDVAGGGAEPGGIERSVDLDHIVRLNLNLLPIDLGDDTQQVELRDRIGGHVIEAVEVGSREDIVPDHAGKLDPWEPRVD